ncbi:hypothetical protein [Photobacterium damselae]|uniref:hypothetical protein n=1 Tax=Photobacterium damselae TaxID=38293 RepID=UPI001EFCB16E|nr:hypothetical protein [Photobacterium damselae]MCG9780458.1 hypothetical protein [Photobacterium damselae]
MTELQPLELNNDAANSLEHFIGLFNAMIQDSDRMADTINNLNAKLEDYHHHKNRAEGYANQIVEMEQEIGDLQNEVEELKNILLTAEKVAHAKMKLEKDNQALTRELDLSRNRAKELQRQLNELKGGDNPKKLREQIKRLKDKAKEKDAKNSRLEREAKQYRQDIQDLKVKQNQAIDKIKTLKAEKQNIDFTGLYHSGDHHLILWPQVITSQNEDDGSIHQSRALLHMHQSGTARLITFDVNNNASVLHKAPAGGVRLPKEVRQFADDWLFNVNVTQNGNVTPKDLQQTDLNSAA